MSKVPPPVNEPNLGYLPGSPERAALKATLASMAAERIDIPITIGGREIRTGRTRQAVMPHDHRHVLADWHVADAQHVHDAIAAAKTRAKATRSVSLTTKVTRARRAKVRWGLIEFFS